jgi:hypothetical protein
VSFWNDLAQHQINHPTPSDMRPWSSAVVQNFIVVAPSFVQGMSQFWHPVKGSVVVDCPSQLDHGRRQHGEIEGDGAERIAEYVTDQGGLRKKPVSVGAEQWITDDTSLGAVSSISGSYFRFRRSSIPGRLASRSLTCKTSGTQFVRANMTIGEILGCLHCNTTEIVHQAPDAPRTSNSEQAQLAVTRLAPKELEHRVWIRGIQPLRFSHRQSTSTRTSFP